MSLDKLLPFKFQQIDAWKDLADVYESKIFNENLDSFKRIRDLREVTLADADQLQNIKELLGIPISIDSFIELEKRRLFELIPFWYEKSGTKFFIDLLRFVKNADVELFELFNNVDVTGEVLNSGDGGTVAFAGNLTLVPIDLNFGDVVITDGTQVLTDDGAGNFTGDGTGTIDYITGAYNVTFNAAPPAVADNIVADYFTHGYQEFVKEADVTGTYTKDGGYFYLTNHVGLIFDLEVFDPGNITALFYQIASTVLVLRSLEGLVKGLNDQPLQYTGEGHVELDITIPHTTKPEFRNIPSYARIIDDLNAKFSSIGLEPSDEFEPALISTPNVVIPRHLHVVGDVLLDSIVVGAAVCDDIDSLSPSVEVADLELPVFDLLSVQEVYRSDLPMTMEAVSDSETLTTRTLVVGNVDLDGLLYGDIYLDFVVVGDMRIPNDGVVSNALVLPLTPGTVVVTDSVETFSDDGLGNLTGDMGGTGAVDYSSGQIVAKFNVQPSNPVIATFEGGNTEFNTGYRPVLNTFNWEVGQTDLDTLIIGDRDLDRLHAGQIDIAHVPVEPYATSQFSTDYTYWRNNIVFGGPRLSGSWTYLPHGTDAIDGVSEIQVRYSSTSDSGPWSAWESLKGSNFTARWLQYRLHYERPAPSYATVLLTESRYQLDVRDKRETLLRESIPVSGYTYNFDNDYFITPSTVIVSDDVVVVDSKDKNQVVFHLEDNAGSPVASVASVEVRGY